MKNTHALPLPQEGSKSDPRFAIKCLTAASKDRTLPASAKNLLTYLILAGDGDGGNCFRAHRIIADDLGWSRRWVRTNLARLEELGWIQQIPFIRPDGGTAPHLFRLFIPDHASKRGRKAGALRWDKRHWGSPQERPE